MLDNRGQRPLGGQKKQPANDFLKGRMQFPFATVGPMRNTRAHSVCAGPPHQAREGGASELYLTRCFDNRGSSQHGFDDPQIAQEVRSHRALEGGVVKGGKEASVLRIPLLLNRFRHHGSAAWYLPGKRIREHGGSVGRKTQQRGEPSERDRGKIDQQMTGVAALSAQRFQIAASRSACGQRSPSRSTTSCTQAASPQGQMTRPRFFKLWPRGKRLTPRMQKDQMRLSRFGQGCLRPNPVDPCLLLGDFARRFRFGSIALPAFVLFKTCLRNQEPAVEQLTDGIGKIDVGLTLQQVVDGERNR